MEGGGVEGGGGSELSVRVERYQRALDDLFKSEGKRAADGYSTVYAVSYDADNPDELKKRVEAALAAGLEEARAEMGANRLPASKMKFSELLKPATGKTQLDYEREVNEFEMALGVIRGERADVDKLTGAVGKMADRYTGQLTADRDRQIRELPATGWFGLGGKDERAVDRITSGCDTGVGVARGVVDKVMQQAPAWGRK